MNGKQEYKILEITFYSQSGQHESTSPHIAAGTERKQRKGVFRDHLTTVSLVSAIVLGLAAGTPSIAQQAPPKTKTASADSLYTLDCGLTEFKDADYFSDTGEYEDRSLALPTPCYLIRHGKDWLLWDTGNGDRLSALPKGMTTLGGRFTMPRTLAGQLAQLELKPDDIRYVALSHLHQDHAGNINLFPKATFLLSSTELDWARAKPTPFGVDPAAVISLAHVRIDAKDTDQDVFGDGSVRILKAPGHTPGSRMLLIKLAKSGTVLLSGDVYHTRENYEKGLVPSPNVSRADTLASFQRFTRIVANTHARVVIQHAPEDFAAMPAFPNFLD